MFSKLLGDKKKLLKYVLFGCLTTVVNVGTYYLCSKIIHHDVDIFFTQNVLSTAIAWLAAVIFAFLTNKYYVFGSKSFKPGIIFKEAAKFFSFRAITGVMELIMMYYLVDVWHFDGMISKLGVNVVVVILNYIASVFIFKKEK